MNLRQVVVSGSLAALLAAFSTVPAFAADATDAAQNTNAANAVTSQPAPATKKSIRAANRAFSRTVQKALQKTKGLEQASIAVFGNAKTGQVTLAGQILSEDQEAVAVNAAKQVHGVTLVSSKLSLHQQGGG
ncbi:BON domain-containing protein [Paraburkholderia fungorum]|uniref:BON domain-containing protein n=1 Tax=Paraburkholderia fungorum TaxID=134537 RepID=A0A1H1JHE4_9BURK|nr:BON domain-containing protein [Paraburkholderia fungorum]SDR49159.1 BON domain-containing protein [Paraburkholderia fungorum]